jgi:hypothetical protein
MDDEKRVGRVMIFNLALTNYAKPCLTFVTPAKAGVQHRHFNFRQQVMDSRLRGNDEVAFDETGFGRGQRI